MQRHSTRATWNQSLFAGLRRTFRERQIYLRSDGHVRFVTLRPGTQVIGLVGLVGLFVWLAFATVNVAFKDQIIALKERRINEVRLAYEDRLSAMRSAVDKLNDRLLLNQDAYLAKVDMLREDYEALIARHRRLEQFFQHAWQPASEVEDEAAPEGGDATGGPAARDAAPDQRSRLDLPSFRSRYDEAFRRPEDAERPLRELRALLDTFSRMQHVLVDRVEATAVTQRNAAETVVAEVGLDPEALIEASPNFLDNVGGPFVSFTAGGLADDELLQRVSSITQSLAAVEKLHHAIDRMPIIEPLVSFSVTSRFGSRKDPFRGVPAMHTGVDLKAASGTEVHATASGEVVTADWEGAYGRMVEIRHDNGITTRYAHLSGISVTVGERVGRGDVVGHLGSSGRSTGPHLHYETRLEGRPVDPQRFWQARDAFQTQAKTE